MSQFGPPGPRIYTDGDYVLTPKHQPGKVVAAYREVEPQHDDAQWDTYLNCWWTDGDEYLQWVYRVEVNGEVYPWPENMLTKAGLLDILAAG